MKNKRIMLWILAVLPLLVTLIMLPSLPDKVPAHYGLNGEADRWGSRYELLVTPIITIAFVALMVFIGQTAAKQKDFSQSNKKVLTVTNYVIAVVFNGLSYWFLYSASINAKNLYNTDFDLLKLVAVVLSLSYLALGNILPKCKQNAVIGIRTRWTMTDQTVWYKTHRVGGVLVMALGGVSTLLSLLLSGFGAIIVSLGGFLVVTVILVFYSYSQYKKQILNAVNSR